MKPGPAAMNVFLGLNASSEELGLEKFATWSYPDNETVFRFDEYAELGVEEALEREGGARFSAMKQNPIFSGQLHCWGHS